MDEIQAKLDEIVGLVEAARAMPMSASCVVNRAELLALLADARTMLPQALSEAKSVLHDADGVVAEGERQAALIVEQAHEERLEMLADTKVYAEAVRAADQLTAQAQATAETMRSEVDDYVDAKLANFEIVLAKTLTSVSRGRQKLAGRNEFGEFDDAEQASFPG